MLDTGCCGTDFKKEEISVLGVSTLSVPLFFVGLVGAGLLWLPARLLAALRMPYRVLAALRRANLELIGKVALLPRLKCSLSSSAYALSPRASGLVFRYFNLGVLLCLWLLAVSVWLLLIR